MVLRFRDRLFRVSGVRTAVRKVPLKAEGPRDDDILPLCVQGVTENVGGNGSVIEGHVGHRVIAHASSRVIKCYHGPAL